MRQNSGRAHSGSRARLHDDSLEAKAARLLQQVRRIHIEYLRLLNMPPVFAQEFREERLAFLKRFCEERSTVEMEDIKRVKDDGGLHAHVLLLEQLKSGAPLLIERGNLPVDDGGFSPEARQLERDFG